MVKAKSYIVTVMYMKGNTSMDKEKVMEEWLTKIKEKGLFIMKVSRSKVKKKVMEKKDTKMKMKQWVNIKESLKIIWSMDKENFISQIPIVIKDLGEMELKMVWAENNLKMI